MKVITVKSKSGKSKFYKVELGNRETILAQSKKKAELIKTVLQDPALELSLLEKVTPSRKNYYLESNYGSLGRIQKTDYVKIQEYLKNEQTTNTRNYQEPRQETQSSVHTCILAEEVIECEVAKQSEERQILYRPDNQWGSISYNGSEQVDGGQLIGYSDYSDPRVLVLEEIHREMLRARAAGYDHIANSLETIGRTRVERYTIEADIAEIEAETEVIRAETEVIRAETEVIRAEREEFERKTDSEKLDYFRKKYGHKIKRRVNTSDRGFARK